MGKGLAMSRPIRLGMIALMLAGLIASCEYSQDTSYLGRSSGQGRGYAKSYISVKLPDRVSRLTSDSAEQAKTLTTYQVTITPTDPGCGTPIAETGAYQDAYWVQIEADANCFYSVTALVGSGTANAPVTFRADIEPLFEKHCHECHVKGGLMEYFDSTKFEQVQIRTREIMTSVLNDNMPWKRKPLSFAEKELFKQWEQNGFAEGSKAKAKAQLAGKLDKGFFQTGTIPVSPADIRNDRFNLGLTPVFYLTTDGQSAGFKTPSFSSPE